MARTIVGQRVPNQPRAVNRKLFDAPPTGVTPLGAEEDPTKRQTETMVSALRKRKPKKATFMGM